MMMILLSIVVSLRFVVFLPPFMKIIVLTILVTLIYIIYKKLIKQNKIEQNDK